MKSRFFIILLLTLLFVPTFTACGLRTLDDRLDVVEDVIDNHLDALEDTVEKPIDVTEDIVENAVEYALGPKTAPRGNVDATPNQPTQTVPEASVKNDSGFTPDFSGDTATTITRTEAETIALKHAGFTVDDVNHLHTEYDFDDGVVRYEVQFRQGHWEYEYDIHAETGVVLSFDIDD